MTGLTVFAGELVGLQEIQQTIAQAIMEHDILREFKGYKNIVEQGLKEGLKEGRSSTLRHLFERRLGRPLSEGEQAALVEKIEALGADVVSDVVLDTREPEQLQAWLLAP